MTGAHRDDGEDGDGEFGLVMPFLPVTSRGGPYDDDAYVAGYEMGRLAEELETAGPAYRSGSQTIHTSNAEQADLLCMRHGFVAETEPSGVDGWSYLRFRRAAADAPT